MLLLDYLKFLIFGKSEQTDQIISIVAKECSEDLLAQISQAKSAYSSEVILKDKLCSENVTAFIFGFVNDYAERNKIKHPKQIWSVTVRVFHIIFDKNNYGQSEGAYGIQLTILQDLMKKDACKTWMVEGKNAAFYGRNGGMKLFAAFLEGASR